MAPSPDTYEMRCSAINIWLDGAGFISGRSAGRLLGLARMRKRPIEVTLARRQKRISRAPWVEVRQTTWYDGNDDRQRHNGITVATPARMLFGLAADLKDRSFENAADDAWNIGLINPGEVDLYLDRHRCRGKDGVARLERWLEKAFEMERPAQSMLERDLINALCDSGLPEPIRQFPLRLSHNALTVHLDIAWPDIRLAIEPGHNRFHRGVDASEQDTLRDLACGELGLDIIRLTQQIQHDLPVFAQQIRRVYLQRRRDIPLSRRGPISSN